jgi:hypothetical protein
MYYYLLHSVQIGSGAFPAFYPMVVEVKGEELLC